MFGRLTKRNEAAAPIADEPVTANDDGIEQLDDGRVRVRLRWPVEFAKKRVDELTLRRPRGVDMKRLPAGDPKEASPYALLQFVAGLIEGQPPAIGDLLDFEDISRLNEVANRFF